ncbi:TPA: hypothetical protein KNH77_003821 [Clostridioides difficile]|uniref:Uncharacterized protein n=2 Tax=Clostridioides difficile TaxID=1496 RepID=A0AB74QGX7_CLODI|nr:hypothetical protein [Clostridioides difficile]EIS9447439.1 hypothetical protein [Clostridioides difficile]EIS9595066.1 hypothetical protein [Clostridioides difficile]ELX4591881.1 hypothetical protein [Clostridioides difficile]MBH6835578.1 hypothetical protein [Clostridioides difficile]MBZ0834565.1 hypothetical protein [Clostridioides difficile]
MKLKLKKSFIFITTLSFIFTNLSISLPVFADSLQENIMTIQEPRYTNISKATSELSISGSNAIIKTTLLGKLGITKTTITSTLQKKVNNNWQTVDSWTVSKNDKLCTLSKTKSISKGTYRVSSVVIAYKGSTSERDTLISASKTY